MRLIIGLVFGFITGTFYSAYQFVEVEDSFAIKAAKIIKIIVEVIK
jgi:hypothetical protein